MSGKREQASEDFGWVANTLLAVDSMLVFLSLVSRIVIHKTWVPMVFFSVFRLPGTGLLGTVLNPQALFSPMLILFIFLFWPIAVQVWCWVLIWPVMRGWETRTKLMYFLISLIPIFGPAGAYNLMKTQEELAVD
jgi:hypothetical protein